MPKPTMRESTENPSVEAVGCARPQPAKAAITITVSPALWRNVPRSRSTVMRTSVTPSRPTAVGHSAMGARPSVAACTNAMTREKVTASLRARAARISTKERLPRTRRGGLTASDRTAPPPRAERADVERDGAHVGGPQAQEHTGLGRVLRQRQHPVAGPAQDHERARQPGAEVRRHRYERRAGREPAALLQEDRLGSGDRVRPEPGEDVQRARERPRTAGQRGAGPLMGDVVEAVRDH